MKKLILFIVLSSFSSYAQLKVNDSGAVYYEEVVETKKTKSEIHGAVQEFLATKSGNSNYTIRINNEDQILSKGNITVIGPNKLDVVLNTEFKEGKYRILLDPISWNGKHPLTPEMNFDKTLAKQEMKDMYYKNGNEKLYDKKEKKGEIDADINRFVAMQQKLYDTSKVKLLAFVEALKSYVENKKDSDW